MRFRRVYSRKLQNLDELSHDEVGHAARELACVVMHVLDKRGIRITEQPTMTLTVDGDLTLEVTVDADPLIHKSFLQEALDKHVAVDVDALCQDHIRIVRLALERVERSLGRALVAARALGSA